MNSNNGQVYSIVYCNFLVLLSTTVCSQNINKQNVNIADETIHWIPMFNGTPCSKLNLKRGNVIKSTRGLILKVGT